MNVSVTPVPGSTNQLMAKWEPPNPTNGIITAYMVYCNVSVNQTNAMYIKTSVNGTTHAVTFSIRSDPLALYSCYVTANTSVGEGTPSSVVVGRTGESGEQRSILSSVTPLQLNKPLVGMQFIFI